MLENGNLLEFAMYEEFQRYVQPSRYHGGTFLRRHPPKLLFVCRQDSSPFGARNQNNKYVVRIQEGSYQQGATEPKQHDEQQGGYDSNHDKNNAISSTILLSSVGEFLVAMTSLRIALKALISN